MRFGVKSTQNIREKTYAFDDAIEEYNKYKIQSQKEAKSFYERELKMLKLEAKYKAK